MHLFKKFCLFGLRDLGFCLDHGRSSRWVYRTVFARKAAAPEMYQILYAYKYFKYNVHLLQLHAIANKTASPFHRHVVKRTQRNKIVVVIKTETCLQIFDPASFKGHILPSHYAHLRGFAKRSNANWGVRTYKRGIQFRYKPDSKVERDNTS